MKILLRFFCIIFSTLSLSPLQAQQTAFTRENYLDIFSAQMRNIIQNAQDDNTTKVQKQHTLLKEIMTYLRAEKDATLYLNFTEKAALLLYKFSPNILLETFASWEKDLKNFGVEADTRLAFVYRQIGSSYYVMQKDSLALLYFEKSIGMRQQLGDYGNELSRDYSSLSSTYIVLRDYYKAMNALEKALVLANSDTLLINIHQSLAQCYQHMNEMDLALKHIDLSYTLSKKIFGDKTVGIVVNRLIKAQILSNQHQFDLCLQTLENLEEILISPSKQPEPQLLNTLFSLYYYQTWGYINLFRHQQMDASALDSAIFTTNKAIKLLESSNAPNPTLASNYISLAYIHYLKTNRQTGIVAFEKAKAQAEKYIQTHFATQAKYLGDIAMINAQMHTLKEDYEKSAAYFQQFLQYQIPSYAPQHNYDFPNLTLIEKHPASIPAILQNINPLLENLYAAYQATKAEKYLDELLNFVAHCEKLVQYQEEHVFDASSYANLNSNNAYIMQGIYHYGIYALYKRYEKDKNPAFFDTAFYYSEKCKGANLLKKINNMQVAFLDEIDKKDIQKERQLSKRISQLNQEIFLINEATQKQENMLHLLQLQDELMELKKQYNEHLNYLESTYPAYKKLKYNLDIISRTAAQALLQEEQALLSYCISSKGIFIFDLRKGDMALYFIEREDKILNRTLEKFQRQVSKQYDTPRQAIQSGFVKNAHELYQLLLAPVGNLPKRLIIIPDKLLNKIPFEVLLEREIKEENISFKAYPFLVKNTAIAYNYSATLLQSMQSPSQQPYKKQYLGFAPSFPLTADANSLVSRYGLTHLAANEREIQAIKELFNTGDIYLHQAAYKEQFLEKAPYYRILHLATHGLANHQDPNYSFLAFTHNKGTENTAFLYMNELYNMYLSAELVILSACETNDGNVSQGEGILSMARAFAAAGAKSLFTTLWKVNDETTANMVILFSKYLKEGKAKDIALQAAKVEYLELMSEEVLSPSLWSAYTIIGDDAPLENIAENNTIYWVIGGVVLLLGMGTITYSIKRKKDKSYA